MKSQVTHVFTLPLGGSDAVGRFDQENAIHVFTLPLGGSDAVAAGEGSRVTWNALGNSLALGPSPRWGSTHPEGG